MSIGAKKLIGLPVYTQSGDHLGKVVDFTVDQSQHVIQQYIVRSRDLIGELLQKELLVGPEQVISITAERMTVEDALIADREAKKQPVPAA